MTLEAWLRPTARDSRWRTALMLENQRHAAYAVATSANKSVKLAGSAKLRLHGAIRLARNRWSYLAVTYADGAMKIYVNGKLVATQHGRAALPSHGGVLKIGGGKSPFGRAFRGVIDDVRVYDRAIGSDQVAQDMATPVR